MTKADFGKQYKDQCNEIESKINYLMKVLEARKLHLKHELKNHYDKQME